MAIEARPYAFSAMFTALALFSVVKLHQRKSLWYSLLLGLAMIGAVSAHLFSALPLIGLIIVAFVVLPNGQRLAVAVSSFLAGLACLPLGILGVQQRHQVGWIASAPFNIADQALVEAWFTSRVDPNPNGDFIPLHYIAVALSVLAAATVVAPLLAGRRPLPMTRLALGAIPLVLAVGVLWGQSVLDEPVLMGRYFTSSAPFFAMLLAECILLLRPYVKQIMASLLIVGCLILIVSQRQPHAKIPWNDFSFIAATIDKQSNTGDGLLIEPSPIPTDTARSAIDLYPEDFRGLVDIAQPQTLPLTHPISVDAPLVDLSVQAPLPSRIWLVSKVRQDAAYAAQLSSLGYQAASSSSGPGHTVTLWMKQ
jgi:mannosyltransferase